MALNAQYAIRACMNSKNTIAFVVKNNVASVGCCAGVYGIIICSQELDPNDHERMKVYIDVFVAMPGRGGTLLAKLVKSTPKEYRELLKTQHIKRILFTLHSVPKPEVIHFYKEAKFVSTGRIIDGLEEMTLERNLEKGASP